jgi:hypothetical protein
MSGYYEIKTNGTTFSFVLKAGNHEVILSSQSYTTRTSAMNGIASVQTHCAAAGNFDRREASNGSPYFVLKASNGQIIGNSEMYSSAGAMENGITSVQKNGPSTEIREKA